MIYRSVLNNKYIQPLETCLAFSCPLTLSPLTSCLDILVVRHFYVHDFQRPSDCRPQLSRVGVVGVNWPSH